MKSTLQEKINDLTAGPLYLEDELAERLAVKLTSKDIQDLRREARQTQQSYDQRFACELLEKTPRARTEILEKIACPEVKP
jgi:hypothetical protein